MESDITSPMDDIIALVVSLNDEVTIEPQSTEDIVRFTFWVSHIIIEIRGDELRYAIFGGDHNVEGLCANLSTLERVLTSEFQHLQTLFAREQQDIPGPFSH